MIKNKKIMMITTTDNMIWQFMLPHIKHLQELGNTVECVCAKTGFWFEELKNKHDLVVHEIDFGRNPLKLKNFKAYKKLKALQEERQFDLVYSQQPVGGLMGRLVAKKFKLPCIYTAHGFAFLKGKNPLKNFIFKTVEKWLAKYTDVLITINEEDYQAAKKWKAKKVYKINGIGMDEKKYENALMPREEMRKSLGLKDEFTVLTVAEFIKRKNYDTMLRAIADLKDENIKFLVCGTGSEKENIENLIKDLKIEDKVQLLGYRKDIHNIMKASDCFMLASHQEGLTLSVMEAMHFGLPCVVSDVRGNRDLIVDGRGGYVMPKNDHLAFANGINALMKAEHKRVGMQNFNCEESKKYTIEKVKEQLEKIYEEMETK